MSFQPGSLRVAVIDGDSGFVRVLGKRIEDIGWQYRVIDGPFPAEELVAMRLNALLVDLSVLGPRGWDFLERACGSLPGPPSPSAYAACASEPTTGSPSPATPRR
jgi:hypothetical protein